jgi:hypothetical protein
MNENSGNMAVITSFADLVRAKKAKDQDPDNDPTRPGPKGGRGKRVQTENKPDDTSSFQGRSLAA